MRSTLLLAVALSQLVACHKSAPAPGKVVALASVCNEPDGSRVRVSGYVRYERSMLSFCSNFGGHKTCDLELYETAAAPADFDVLTPQKGPAPTTAKLSVSIGREPGQMDELPEKFSAAEIKLHLPNDALAGDGAHATLDGTLSVIPGSTPKSCFINVDWATP